MPPDKNIEPSVKIAAVGGATEKCSVAALYGLPGVPPDIAKADVLAILVLAVSIKIFLDLTLTPDDLFSLISL